MGRVICDLAISADGYSAGLNQTEDRPFGGDGGDGSGSGLHAWMFDTPEENRAEITQLTAAKAVIMGRNMFGPVRGEWDRQWNGCWVGDGDVAILGGANTINQYLAAGLIGEVRLHIVPLTLGAGTRLFADVPPLKLEQVKSRAASSVTHVTYRVLA
jgi:dihydrofolate reductase